MTPNPEVSPARRAPLAWGAPLARLDGAWTHLESLLCAVVLVAEILALCAWIAMKGLSTPTTADNKAGLVFRAIVGAVALGLLADRLTRKSPERVARVATLSAVGVGLLASWAWRGSGIAYCSNFLNWYQESSTLTLAGGLRGVASHLTVWLALLGASLATASGKHINIDIVMRFFKPGWRIPAAIAGWVAAAVVCFAAVVGFFDHIAIGNFGAKADATASEKIEVVAHDLGDHMFLVRKQIGLDLRTLPHVVLGERYDSWLRGADWNAWIRDGGWSDRYTPAQVESVLVPDASGSDVHGPLVVVPGGTNRGILGHALNLMFPFGLAMIGLRFLLRALLAASFQIDVDPDAAHGEPDVAHAHDATDPEVV